MNNRKLGAYGFFQDARYGALLHRLENFKLLKTSFVIRWETLPTVTFYSPNSREAICTIRVFYFVAGYLQER